MITDHCKSIGMIIDCGIYDLCTQYDLQLRDLPLHKVCESVWTSMEWLLSVISIGQQKRSSRMIQTLPERESTQRF